MNEVEFLKFCDSLQINLKLSRIPPARKQLIRNINAIIDGCHRLLPYAKQCNYKDINANGYWAYMKVAKKFLELIMKNAKFMDKCYDDFVTMSKLMLAYLNSVEEITKGILALNQNNDPNFSLLSPITDAKYHPHVVELGIKMMLIFFNSEDYRKGLETSFAKYPAFWLDENLARVYKMTHLGLAFSQVTPLSLHRVFMDDTFFLTTIADIFYNMSNHSVSFWGSLFTVRLPSICNKFMISTGVRCRTLRIPKCNPYVIEDSTIEKQGQRDGVVRCRFITNTSPSGSQKSVIVLHCHGGGYCAGSPDADEALFLKDWCKNLPIEGILSVSYALCEKFPRPLQDVFDAYYWLMTSKELFETYGISPDKVIVCGDSAGGGLILSLLLVLHDLEQLHGVKIQRPSSVVSLYSFHNPSMGAIPSRCISAADTFTFMSLGLLCHAFPGGAFEIDDYESTKAGNGSVVYRAVKYLVSIFYRPEPSKPWYLNSESEYRRMHQHCAAFLSTRYATPLFSEEMKNVKIPLFLITTEFCPLLDDTVALARIWKGPVTLDVLTDLPHSFLYFRFLSPKASQAHELCLNRLREAIES